jgi:hypothetical protein
MNINEINIFLKSLNKNVIANETKQDNTTNESDIDESIFTDDKFMQRYMSKALIMKISLAEVNTLLGGDYDTFIKNFDIDKFDTTLDNIRNKGSNIFRNTVFNNLHNYISQIRVNNIHKLKINKCKVKIVLNNFNNPNLKLYNFNYINELPSTINNKIYIHINDLYNIYKNNIEKYMNIINYIIDNNLKMNGSIIIFTYINFNIKLFYDLFIHLCSIFKIVYIYYPLYFTGITNTGFIICKNKINIQKIDKYLNYIDNKILKFTNKTSKFIIDEHSFMNKLSLIKKDNEFKYDIIINKILSLLL